MRLRPYENYNNSELLANGELVTDIDVTGGGGQHAFYVYKRLKSAKISGEAEIAQYDSETKRILPALADARPHAQ